MDFVHMLIICWIPVSRPQSTDISIIENWRIDTIVTAEHCNEMNEIFTKGGGAGVISVRCSKLSDYYSR